MAGYCETDYEPLIILNVGYSWIIRVSISFIIKPLMFVSTKSNNQTITSELNITNNEAPFKIQYLLTFYHRIPIPIPVCCVHFMS